MIPEAKAASLVAEKAVHDILKPLGFKKQKMNWRRRLDEIHQQFSIVSVDRDDEFQPAWGLNIISLCEDPRPVPWRLQVRWYLARSIENVEWREQVYHSFEYQRKIDPEARIQVIQKFLNESVVPCFDKFQTKESVKTMMGTYKYPFRAHQFWNLPDEWWPPD